MALIKKKKKVVRGAPRVKRGSKMQGISFADYEKMSGYEFHKHRQKAVDFYYQNYKASDVIPFAYQWMKVEGYSKKDISSAKKGSVSTTVAIYSKLLVDGCPDYYESHNDYWESCPGTMNSMRPITEFVKPRIEEAIAAGSLVVDEQKVADEEKVLKPVLSIQEKLRITSLNYAMIIEEELDEIANSIDKYDIKKFNPVNTMRKHQIKANHARIIRQYFQPVADEYSELVGPKKKNDDMYDQLLEGYSHISTKSQKKLSAVYQDVIQACEMIITSQKTSKVRAKKPVARDKVVSRMKYQKEDMGLKLASISPVDILDATELWVYNTKTRKLGKYIVDDMYDAGNTLSVKGTSIIGFKQDISVQKTLRKPDEQLAELKKLGKVQLRKFMDSIKTTDTKLNGRINDQTILLKIAK